MFRLEATILKNLIYSDAYMRKVLPYLKPEYFKEQTERIVYQEIAEFIDKYHNLPTHEALVINVTESTSLKEKQVQDAVELLKMVHLDRAEPTDLPWLSEQTEKFCKDAALYNAVLEAVSLMDDTKTGADRKPREAIPDILTKALAISFDPHVGHDYMLQADSRFDFYHHTEKKVPFDLEFFNKVTAMGFSTKTLNIFLAGTGVGKAQPDSIMIPTPKGNIAFGELSIGDSIFGANGTPTKVLGVFPQGKKAIYKITFADGRTTTACGEHLWNVYDSSGKIGGGSHYHTLSTYSILECWKKRTSTRHRLYVPLATPLVYEKTELPIHPYLMGALLGDGHITSTGSASITVGDDNSDMVDKIKLLIPSNAFLRKRGITYHISVGRNQPHGWQGSTNSLSKSLRDLKMNGKRSWEKFIPKDYLTSSIEDRVLLLQGLMDTDGYISKNQSISYSTTSELLKDGVVTLIRGLGGIAKVSSRVSWYTYKGIKKRGRLCYNVSIRIPRTIQVFSTSKKVMRYSPMYQYSDLHLRIEKIEQAGEESCRCILVEAPDHLYVTENFIVTHNTLVMCHMAAAAAARGYNVLYITMEMAEERIAERIDANLLDVDINLLKMLTKVEYDKKFASLKNKTNGKIIIKEYPTASASTLHFKALLNELQLKKNFKPAIIFIDYLNICASSRIRPGGNVNSYTYIKAIAEELRGMGVEFDVPVVSATQTTRGGFDNSDLELTDTSESFGLPATADFMAAIISNEDLEALGQIMIKILKNRYQDKNVNKRFVVGVDRPKMRLYDVSPAAQQNIQDAGQVKPDPHKPFDRPQKSRDFSKFKL